MKRVIILLAIALIGGVIPSYAHHSLSDSLQKDLNEYVKDKDAVIGIAVIVDRKDTISINGDRPFPMLSVYKYPIAVALGGLSSGLR